MHKVLVRYEGGSDKFKSTSRPQSRRRVSDGTTLYSELNALSEVEYAIRVKGQSDWEISLINPCTRRERKAAVEKIKQCFSTHGIDLDPDRRT